jgi:hypothetical protein
MLDIIYHQGNANQNYNEIKLMAIGIAMMRKTGNNI